MATEGQKGIDRKTGEAVVFTNGEWRVAGGKALPMEASMRSRMDLGLGPMVQGQETMAAVEGRGNPYQMTGPKATPETRNNAIAEMIGGIGIDAGPVKFHPFEGVAKRIGGDDYQEYDQGAKAFESQLMPIMSGAAVSPTEAQRQIRAALPQLGDSEANLASKGRTRQMMLNGAAKAKGLPLPYPDVPTWGVNTSTLPKGAAPKTAPAKPKFKYLGPE